MRVRHGDPISFFPHMMPERLRCGLVISLVCLLLSTGIRQLSPGPRGKPSGSSDDSPGRQPNLGPQLAEPCLEASYPTLKGHREKTVDMFLEDKINLWPKVSTTGSTKRSSQKRTSQEPAQLESSWDSPWEPTHSVSCVWFIELATYRLIPSCLSSVEPSQL